MKKYIGIIIGVISLALGIVGIILPLLPTTPFILLAAVAFSQSSPKLHHWLTNHPHLGAIIKNWQNGGRIDKRSKTVALTLMVLMPLISYIFGAPMWAIGVQVLVLSMVAAFILSRPS